MGALRGWEGLDDYVVVLLDLAVVVDDEDDAGGPGVLAVGVGQVNRELGDVSVDGDVIAAGQRVLAAAEEGLVRAGDPGVELVVPAELDAVEELGAVGRPNGGDRGAAGSRLGLGPQSQVVTGDVGDR